MQKPKFKINDKAYYIPFTTEYEKFLVCSVVVKGYEYTSYGSSPDSMSTPSLTYVCNYIVNSPGITFHSHAVNVSERELYTFSEVISKLAEQYKEGLLYATN